MAIILIADNNEAFVQACFSEFASRNIQSVVAHSADEMLVRLRSHVTGAIVNLAIADAENRVWSTLRARRIPVIAVNDSSLGDVAPDRLCREMGLEACYEKPVNLALILKTLQASEGKALPPPAGERAPLPQSFTESRSTRPPPPIPSKPPALSFESHSAPAAASNPMLATEFDRRPPAPVRETEEKTPPAGFDLRQGPGPPGPPTPTFDPFATIPISMTENTAVSEVPTAPRLMLEKPEIPPGLDVPREETKLLPLPQAGVSEPKDETRVLPLPDAVEAGPGAGENSVTRPHYSEKEIVASRFNDVLLWAALIIGGLILWWAIRGDD